jgi:outer membrane receptor protein involved in Fe transport
MSNWLYRLSALVLLTGSVAVAQSTSSITGVVTDGATGKPVVGAQVTATSPAAPGARTAVTDARGVFTIANLPAGQYQLTSAMEGYNAETRAALAVGENVTLRANLAIVPEAARLEEVVVTGSRIRRKDLNTPAPVTMVSREQFVTSGKRSVADFLQALPEQGNAVNAQVNNGGGNANTDGSTRINLRNLGTNRTLVLVNGRRFVAGGLGADASVDLNSIPTAAVERVEVLKDGASAIYGSDAIGGVVNIITRKAIVGTEASVAATSTGRGDGQAVSVDLTTGGSSGDGHFLYSVSYSQEYASWLRNRSWSKYPLTYDYAKRKADYFGSYAVPAGDLGLPTAANGVDPTPGCLANPRCAGLVASDPSWASDVFVADPTAALGFRPITDADTYNYALQNYLTTPNTRVQAYATGDTRFGAGAEGFYELSYVQRHSRQNAAPMPLYPGDYGINVSQYSMYNPLGVDLPFAGRRLVEFGRREYSQDLTTFRVVTGVRGVLPDGAGRLAGLAWDASLNYGRTSGSYQAAGAIRNSRVADSVGPSMDINGTPSCVRTPNDPTTVIPGCVPLNLFGGPGTISPSQIEGLGYTGTSRALDSMVAADLNLNGELGRLGSDRPVGLAVGYEYRTERGENIADPIAAAGDSADANFKSTAGSYAVHEVFAELSLPLLSNLPGVQDLEASLAGRYVDYSSFGGNFSYKAGLRYSPVRDLTLRGTVSTAFRAPSISELYLGNAQGFPVARDPCTDLTAASPELAAQCRANGVNGNGSNDPRTQIISLLGGKPDLKPESANIFTMGVVLEPQAVSNLTATVDYYNVFVNHAIGTKGVPSTLASCFPGAGGTPDPAACALIHRDTNGRILFIDDRNQNLGWDKTAGFDLAIRWFLPTSMGRFGADFDGTYLATFNRKMGDGTVVHGAGNFDLFALPRIKANVGANWAGGAWGAGAGAHFIGSFKECAASDGTSSGGLCYQNESLGSRQVGTNTTINVHGTYQLTSAAGKTSVIVGVNNVFDQRPQYVYASILANSDAMLYDFLGRSFYARLTHVF